jgi:hypothetical protein
VVQRRTTNNKENQRNQESPSTKIKQTVYCIPLYEINFIVKTNNLLLNAENLVLQNYTNNTHYFVP